MRFIITKEVMMNKLFRVNYMNLIWIGVLVGSTEIHETAIMELRNYRKEKVEVFASDVIIFPHFKKSS